VKIAVASSDGTHISPHFGRSSHFLLFDVEDGKVFGKEVRSNTFTVHARGECSGGHDHNHAAHSHASIVEALRDCNAVLCYGMGWRAAEDLERAGIQPFVLEEDCTPERAVTLFLDGKLAPASQGFCRGRNASANPLA
jgi:predicted Fe-Mo cluster-binding NifX family protein